MTLRLRVLAVCVVLCACAVCASAALPAVALAVQPQVSLTDIEDQVMCVSCHTPLAVSESPQGNAERDFIRSLIARGDSKQKILDELVAQYGDGVLALPRAHGFNLVVYILPPLAVVIGVAGLAWSLPKWRRRAAAARARGAAAGGPDGAGPALDPADAAKLDADLARFGR